MDIIVKREDYALRRWRPTDARHLAKHANNINIWNNVRDYFPYPYTEKDAKAYLSMVLKEKVPTNFAIIVNNEAVGGVGYIPGRDVERFSAEIGYWLGEEHWGKGIMGRALNDAIKYIFTHTEIIRLFTCVFEYNTASMKVLEKNGFRKVGIMKNAAVKNGRIIDMHSFELIK